MRIRGGRIPSAPDRGHHASPSTSSSSSSITAAAAPSSSSLVSSSQDSSNSFSFTLLEAATTTTTTAAATVSPHRCRGLDLLVKAIHQVTAGSVIGVPYIQRRVTIRRRRRRRGFQFDGVVLTEILGHHSGDKGQQNEKRLKGKQRKGMSKSRQRRGIRIPF